MIHIIGYLVKSINPESTDNKELVITDCFDADIFNTMKQDGIMITTSTDMYPPSEVDCVKVNTFLICRKNIPNQLAWFDQVANNISFDPSRIPIYRRLAPPYETIDHALLIKNIICETKGRDKTYIEYGVNDGKNIESIAECVSKAIGIDIVMYESKTQNLTMHCMTTNEFSENHLPFVSYDYAFIDADHSSKQVLIDFDNLFKYINLGGYIFLHDTYPCEEFLLAPRFCNDCYLSPILIREKYPNVEILTIPLSPGLTIVRKK